MTLQQSEWWRITKIWRSSIPFFHKYRSISCPVRILASITMESGTQQQPGAGKRRRTVAGVVVMLVTVGATVGTIAVISQPQRETKQESFDLETASQQVSNHYNTCTSVQCIKLWMASLFQMKAMIASYHSSRTETTREKRQSGKTTVKTFWTTAWKRSFKTTLSAGYTFCESEVNNDVRDNEHK